MTLDEYLAQHGSKLTVESERTFVTDFLYPLLGEHIGAILPQYPFIDRTGRSRRIDFVCHSGSRPIALEINGETFHAPNLIDATVFDDNLFRQNEIFRLGYHLMRFSYQQLLSPIWRPLVAESLRDLFGDVAPHLLVGYQLQPTPLQIEALDALSFYRARGWRKGVVILPTGTGKTILSALDARRVGGRVLFLVHRLDILRQSVEAFKKAWGTLTVGYLTGDVAENEHDCDVLFASKDTLRQPHQLARFDGDWFDYMIIDEVHHGQSPSYRDILTWFQPKFMLGMTATPDRTDRKDIFELFEYNKVFELPLQEAIERGFLVPYTYVGLTDNVDYSRIRWHGNSYRVDDLERLLIIPERNDSILREYLHRGGGDKAIGFCISITHAERMAEFFNQHGVAAAAIHSGVAEREQLIADFRENRYQVAFTVDLFNEGIDFPNVRVLLFLRPTESKTVFLQQLGRGLRLCAGKDRVLVLDFIGNYKRANQIRKYLATRSDVEDNRDDDGHRQRKIVYTYATGCEVEFAAEVEELLDRQDTESLGVDKEDLRDAYFELAEELERKPSRGDLDQSGRYRSGLYAQLYGSWGAFLREVGEFTEASYHYPQGTHLGHLLAILWYFGLRSRAGPPFDDRYIRLRGNLDGGRLGAYQRQIKYKLLAAMELGLLEDDRAAPPGDDFIPELTPLGRELREAVKTFMRSKDLTFKQGDDGVPSTAMPLVESDYNDVFLRAASSSEETSALIHRVFLAMPAVQQMMAYLYHVARQEEVPKAQIYDEFFKMPLVRQFCDREGIETATEEAAKRRCPFLLNVLNALGVLEIERSSVRVKRLLLTPFLVRPVEREDEGTTKARLEGVRLAWHGKGQVLSTVDVSVLRELFGPDFLTEKYYLFHFDVWSHT